MDFSFSDEQLMLQESTRRYLASDYGFEQRARILDSQPGWSRAVWQQLAELGLLGLDIDEAYGGIGGGSIAVHVVAQAMGDALVLEPFLESAIIASRSIGRIGSAQQRSEWLPKLAQGECIAVLAHDEVETSLDTTALTTRAERDGDGWRLSGNKTTIIGAPTADVLLVTALIDTGGIGVFLVPADIDGLQQQRYVTVAGTVASDLRFDAIRLDLDARLGDSDDAGPLLQEVLDYGLAALCADALGTLERCLRSTLDYARTRQQFGVPIGRFQALQHRLAELLIHVEQSRSMAFLACTACSDPDPHQRRQALSAAKALIGQAARKVGQEAVQIHGGMGMSDELDVSHCFRRLLAFELRHGATDQHLAAYAAGLATPDSVNCA